MKSNFEQPSEHTEDLSFDYSRLTASAELVNRTHRVVRQRASRLQEERKRIRGLWIPLTVSFGMLALVLIAIWNLFEESESMPNGIPDSGQQMLMLAMWVLPLSVVVLAVVWFRRVRTSNENPR